MWRSRLNTTTVPGQPGVHRGRLGFGYERVRRAALSRWDKRRTAGEGITLGDAVAQLVEEQPARVGLDVFDTLLVRRLVGDKAAEHAIASAIAHHGIAHGSRADYQAARLRARTERPTGPMSSWHRTMTAVSDSEEADDIERTIEDSLTAALPGARPVLDRLRDVSEISYVSDMHLDSDFIGDLLDRHVGRTASERLYVSSDFGTSKSAGGLFEKLDDAVPPVAAFVGNDAWADVTQPALAGIEPFPATAGNPTSFESIMAADFTSTGPAIAGAARLQRLECRAEGQRGPTPRVIGGQVLGQAMSAFMLWVREECERYDFCRLEFLARDGELPLRMARAMPADHWSGVDLAYLHAGRRSWSLAAAAVLGAPAWVEMGTRPAGFLLNSAGVVGFEQLLARCGLTSADVPAGSILSKHDGGKPLGPTEVAQWVELLRSGALDDHITKAAAQPFEQITDFLRQRGLPKGRIGIVDVGWTGQQASLVSALFRAATGHEVIHLHFGGDQVPLDCDGRAIIHRFALDDSVRPHPVRSPVTCIEMLLATGHARLIGYERREDGTVAEVFQTASSSVDNETRRAMHRGAVEVAARLPSRAELDQWGLHNRPLVEETRDLLAKFWNRPDEGLVRALRPLRFEADDVGAVFAPVVEPYHLGELRGRAIIPRTWREGSLAITPVPLRVLARGYFAAKDRLR